MVKNFWSKISGIENEVLEKQGQEINVSYKEKPKLTKKEKIKPREDEKHFEQEWFSETSQGQLIIDLYDKGDSLVIESTIAGVKPEDVDITVEPDLIVIRGERKQQTKIDKGNYYYQECFWGKFSRTLVLPCAIKPDKVKANFKNGLLIINLPKVEEDFQKIEIEK